MYHLLQAGALGKGLAMVFGVQKLLMGAGLLQVPGTEHPQRPQSHPAPLNLHCATRSGEGPGWGALVGRFGGCRSPGTSEHPRGAPPQRELPAAGTKGQGWWARPRRGGLGQRRRPQLAPPELSGEFRVRFA